MVILASQLSVAEQYTVLGRRFVVEMQCAAVAAEIKRNDKSCEFAHKNKTSTRAKWGSPVCGAGT